MDKIEAISTLALMVLIGLVVAIGSEMHARVERSRSDEPTHPAMPRNALLFAGVGLVALVIVLNGSLP